MVEIIKNKKQVIEALKNGAQLHRERKVFYRYPFVYSLHNADGSKIADVSYGAGNKVDSMNELEKSISSYGEVIFSWKL